MILVIDDSPTVLAFVRRHLPSSRVEGLTSFVALPSLLRSDPPDLILLDLKMPAMAGVSFARFVQQHQVRPTPIIIYSSEQPEVLATAARDVGAVAALAKSKDPGELIATVARVLRKGTIAAAR